MYILVGFLTNKNNYHSDLKSCIFVYSIKRVALSRSLLIVSRNNNLRTTEITLKKLCMCRK